MKDFNWTCPFCDRDVTISSGRFFSGLTTKPMSNVEDRQTANTYFIVCPNPDCARATLEVALWKSNWSAGSEELNDRMGSWRLVPPSAGKTFPSYIPQPILEDYQEAYLIKDLSPKASATLARRCLQGIIRDFWTVTPGKLVDEINEIKTRVDPLTWDAIEAVRKIGNIGAHMGKDINLIVDVDADEATLLLGLVETLLRDWYVAREERKKHLNALIAAGKSKTPTKKI